MKYVFVFTILTALCACDGTVTQNQADQGGAGPDAAQNDVAVDTKTSLPDARTPDMSGSDIRTLDISIDTPNEDVRPDVTINGVRSAGCDIGGGIPEGENTFTLENRDRKFVVRLPNGYTNTKAWPLVFALHGNGGSAANYDVTDGAYDIRGEVEDEAILIVTEAINGQWRDYSMPADTRPALIESELLYFEELITRAKTDLCIDETEIFAMGFSGGGSFSGLLGCRRDDIRAIGVGGSVIYFDQANCIGTPAAWITIGTEELVAGREMYRDYFRDRASCDATTTATEPAPCTLYDNCGTETPVHYCQHPDGHIWPTFASEATWQFFKQFVD